MKYTVVFEKAPTNFAAYVPDLPGCVATGATRDEVELNIREAIAFHIEGLKEEGEAVPQPVSWSELVEA
ncbi:MAG TPA: type II toxin-antitoxin system HicB family antitoxin [Dehalococcoidia bacterium]|nr:type II toxin-antitoxin system HicB family antitoxin [Dehalococcoidia bacterium]